MKRWDQVAGTLVSARIVNSGGNRFFFTVGKALLAIEFGDHRLRRNSALKYR